MADFSYQLGVSVSKELPPLSDPLVDVDFCSSTGAAQTPPTLRISLAANGTATLEGVYAKCATVSTTNISFFTDSEFGTNAVNSYVLFQENSGHAAASVRVIAVDTAGATSTNMALLGSGDVAFLKVHPSSQYQCRSVSTSTTGSIQVTVIGE